MLCRSAVSIKSYVECNKTNELLGHPVQGAKLQTFQDKIIIDFSFKCFINYFVFVSFSFDNAL